MESNQESLDALVVECLERLEKEGPGGLEAICSENPEHSGALRDCVAILRDLGLVQGALSSASERGLPDSILGQWLDSCQRQDKSAHDALCAKYPEHAQKMHALLEEWERGGGSIGTPEVSAWETLIEQLQSRGPSHERYEFEGEIARGGMGVIHRVFDKDARRRLALKVMLGEDARRESGDASLGRFIEEAQVTSQLDHPGIVPVHEIGVDGEGQVYFTMMLVKGDDLRVVFDRVADPNDKQWTQTRALNVLLRVCEAMAYAHDKGVIHRDLKPGNVMVGKYGEAYVMDWGLARIAGREDQHRISLQVDASSILTTDRKDAAETPDSPILTMDGAVVGTPAYMPPEQALGSVDEIGPPADVYAMGATLYHLLSGQMPYAQPGGAVSPRTILTFLLQGPPVPLARLASRTPAELVAICEKAMARKIEQRYPDMTELANDLRAFLEQRVVSAYEAGAWAELKKWVMRNRVLASTAAAALLAIVTLSGWALLERNTARENERTATASAEEAENQRDRAIVAEAEAATERDAARQRAEELQQVSDFQAGQLSGVNAEAMGLAIRNMVLTRARAAGDRAGREPEVLEEEQAVLQELLAGADFTGLALDVLDEQVFDGALEELEGYGNQPRVQARLLQTVATTLLELGLLERALEPQKQALEIRRRELGDEHPDVQASVNNLGALLYSQGKLDEAEKLWREVLEGRRRELGDDHSDTLTSINNLGLLLKAQGKLAEAEPLYREALEGRRRELGNEHPDTLISINNLGSLLHAQGKLDEAELALREALETNRRTLGEEHSTTLVSISNLATLLYFQGKTTEAEVLYREVLEGFRRTLGDEHPKTLNLISNLGFLLLNQGKLAEAEPLFCEALEVSRHKLGDEHPNTLIIIDSLGQLLMAKGELAEAEPLLREALEGFRSTLGDEHPNTLISISNLGMLLQARGKLDDAEPLLRETLKGSRHKLGNEDPETLSSIDNLGKLLLLQGEFAEAESLLREVLVGLRRAFGDEHPKTKGVMRTMVELHDAWHEAQPDSGHDAKAAEYRALLGG